MQDATATAAAMAKTIKKGDMDEDDLAKYDLDNYDNEESKGTGECE